jgi:hypothetical protein
MGANLRTRTDGVAAVRSRRTQPAGARLPAIRVFGARYVLIRAAMTDVMNPQLASPRHLPPALQTAQVYGLGHRFIAGVARVQVVAHVVGGKEALRI